MKYIFYLLSVVPVIVLTYLWIQLGNENGWGAWVVVAALFVPIALSFVVGTIGVICIVVKRKRKGKSLHLVIATLISLIPLLLFVIAQFLRI